MGNNSQLIVVLVVFAFSALSWAVNKAREHRQVQAAREAQRKRREQELRTGRSAAGDAPVQGAGGGAGAPLPSLQELAAKRQKQLEELRARQQARARGGSKSAPAHPTPIARTLPTGIPNRPAGPARPVPPIAAPRPSRTPARPTPPTPKPSSPRKPTGSAKPKRRQIVIGKAPTEKSRPRSAQASSRRAPAEPPPSRSRRGRVGDTGGPAEFSESTTRGLLTDVHADSSASTTVEPVEIEAGMFSRGSIRRAIVMNEILSPPVSMREDR